MLLLSSQYNKPVDIERKMFLVLLVHPSVSSVADHAQAVCDFFLPRLQFVFELIEDLHVELAFGSIIYRN
jgi:hypothetical protein